MTGILCFMTGILLGNSRSLDDATEVLLNDTASVNCYPNKSVSIQWHFKSFSNRLYAGERFQGTCRERCRLETGNDGSIILKIPKVKVEDAGWYFCSEESSGKRIGSTNITILRTKFACS